MHRGRGRMFSDLAQGLSWHVVWQGFVPQLRACTGGHIAHPKEPAALGGGVLAQTGDTEPVKVDTRLRSSLPLALSGLRQVATSPDFDFLPKREEKE